MSEFVRWLDRAWARGEAALTVVVLLSMVLIASLSAGVRNLTRFNLPWANALLVDMEWVDAFLLNATLLLAFLGVSLATYHRKHISIDVLTRVLPIKPRYVVHALSTAAAGVIALALTVSLLAAVKLNMSERPSAYEMLGESGPMHVCDATPEQLAQLHEVSRPSTFCLMRALLGAVGLHAEAPKTAFQLVVPLLFFVVALRCLGIAFASAHAVLRGGAELSRLEFDEQARLAAVHAALSGELPESTERS